MRLRRLALKGITRFDQAEIDFTALPEGLIAIAGANGAGKTSILEAPFAALHLEFPTRPGSVYGVAHGRDARLELEVESGQPYRALVAIDAQAQKTEAYLYDGEGKPVTGGKVRDYGAAVAERFGSPRLMLSAALSCQSKRGSFLDLSKADRKDLLAEILDTAGLQRLAEGARARAKAGELALERLRGQLTEAEAELERLAGSGPTEDLTVERARLEAEIATAQADLEAARAEYADLQTRHALAVEAEKQREAKRRDHVELFDRGIELEEKLAELPAERQRAEQRAGAAIAAAELEAGKLQDYQRADSALMGARKLRDCRKANVDAAEQALRQDREELLAKTKETGKAATIRHALAAARRQAGLLGEVPCTTAQQWLPGDDLGLTARINVQPLTLAVTCPLLADARTAKETITNLEAELADVEALEAELPSYQQAVDQADAALKGARQALGEAQAEVERLEPLAARLPAAQAAQARIAELREQIEETLAALAAREREYREQLGTLTARRGTIEAELETMAAANPSAIKSELDAAAHRGQDLRRRADDLQAELRTVGAQIARAEAEAQRRVELKARAAAAREQLASLEADLGDWVTLERALGRDGIQALEIDAAGPELSDLTNELLRSCFGERFEVRFVTQALKADGKAQKEVFDVAVTDHDRGRDGAPVDSLSGGEKTIVSEAISLALAIYVGRHSGRRFETLFRDETAGQLDPENAQRYVAMLRRARVMAGAHQVLFIAQQPEVWQAADAVLYLQDGKVEVRA
jgi:DNA repair protein SbcC/Rad50